MARNEEISRLKDEISAQLRADPASLRRTPRAVRRRQAEDPARGFRPVPDHLLEEAMGICPRCGRLRILPCSSCDPNQ
jgi:hypothetical protein